jgi:hypothetical protein
MRMVTASLVILLAPALALAAAPERYYYLGEVKVSSAAGQPIGSQAILVEKTLDRDNNAFTERAFVVHPDGKTEEYTAHMTVKPDNTFTMITDDKSVEGTGTLFGPAWKWTYFKATFKARNGATIEDENFMADDSAATARKKVIAPNGQVVMYMDMTLKAVTPKTFEILRAGLLKK